MYVGNSLRADQLRGAFHVENRTCAALPARSVQAPELLESATASLQAADPDCAEAQLVGDQEPFVNRVIASLGLALVTRFCQRRLTWRAMFFDLDAGTLQYTHADPGEVARLIGLRADSVLSRASRPLARSA